MNWFFLPAAALPEPTNWILISAALVVAFLSITLVFRVLQAAIGTIVMLAVVLLALQLVFGIYPNDLLQELTYLGKPVSRSLGLGY